MMYNDYLDSLKVEEIDSLFGTWVITEIADVSERSESNALVEKQLGKQLILTKQSLKFNFENETGSIHSPKLSIQYFNEENGSKMNQTFLSYGYQPYKKSAIIINVSDKIFFEVIYLNEICYYNDERFYFLKKVK